MVNWDFSIAQQAINYPIYSTQNGPIGSAVLKFVKNKQNKYAKDYIVRYPVPTQTIVSARLLKNEKDRIIRSLLTSVI